MKILIIDDEPIVLKGLSKLLRTAHSEYDTVCFDKGLEALKYAASAPVDIIICDIQMPQRSGLELCREFIRITDAKIIIISGYEDFNYAKGAIDLGAICYVLKPIRQREILDAVEKAERLLTEERQAATTASAMRLTALQNALIKCANGVQPMAAATFSDPLFCRYQVGVFVISDLIYIDDSAGGLISAFTDCVGSAAFREIGLCAVSQYQRGRFVFVLDTSIRPGTDAAQSLRLLFEERLAFDFYLSFSKLHSGTEQLYIAVSEAILALDRDAFTSVLEDKPAAVDRLSVLPHRYANMLIDLISDNATEKELSVYTQAVNDDIANYRLSTHKLISFYERILVLTAHSFISRIQKDVNPSVFNGLSFQHASQYPNIAAIQSVFVEKVYALSEGLKLYMPYKTKKEQFLQQINSLFEENCSKISLQYTADKLGFNPAYFSVLFKEKVGVNFKDYMLNYKINLAKQLLANTFLHISAIAAQLGYQSSDRFSKVFREKTGVSPMEYRQSRTK